MSNRAISVENVSKEYRIGVLNHGMLAKDLQSAWARWRGLPDPNAPIFHRAHISDRLQGRTFRALDDVSFEVEQGETLGIVGRNGAGKSTLLKILSRITIPTAGRVRLKGRAATLLEVGTGFHPELTGRENVFLNGSILGMTNEEVRKKFDEIVDFAEIEQFIDTPVKRYSSGMYVRLAFSVAAYLEPEILIVDEVLAVGDLHFQKKCLGRMGEIGRDGRTVLFVSHNLTAVNRLCRRSILLEDGKLVADGESSSIVSAYARRGSAVEAADRVFDEPFAPGASAKIRRIRIVENDGSDAVTSIDVSKPFYIHIEYELAEAMRGTTIGIEIYSEEHLLPIISVNDCELDHFRLDRRDAGYYRASVCVPACLLNTGAYHLRVGIVQSRIIVDAAEGAIFYVNDAVGIFVALGYERKNSVLATQLPWSVERCDALCDT